MIHEYQVINDSNFQSFVKSVDSHLKNGWKACGGIAVTQDKDGSDYYYQALTKELSEGDAAHQKLKQGQIPK